MKFLDYKHVIPIQIRFCDIDRLNHVNNACYLNYFELGRIRYFADVYKEKIDWDKTGFILARTEIDHLVPVYLTDEIYCFSKVIRIGTKSITIQSSIVKKSGTDEKKTTENDLIECANGKVVLVAMDYTKMQTIELPAKWVETMKEFEK